MAEFKLDRPPRPKPVVALPRAPGWNPETGMENPPTVRIYTDLSRGVAGCCFCDGPIPVGVTRFVLDVALLVPQTSKNGRVRRKERYYAHSGCLGGLLGNEIRLNGKSCWDCGALPLVGVPPDDPDYESFLRSSQHPFSVFTVSRFAPARLCVRCLRKPKWEQCQGCHVVHPHWMVSEVVDDLDAKTRDAWAAATAIDSVPFVVMPWKNGPVLICPTCSDRAGLRTRATEEAVKAEFDELRRKVAEEGIFGDDET